VNSEKYIGLDVHQATIVVAVMDATGKLVMESILETKAATILQLRQNTHPSDYECNGDVSPTVQPGFLGAHYRQRQPTKQKRT
jgi:hypothetical protein